MLINQEISGSANVFRRFASVTYRYLGGRSGQPEPSNLPAGPILVRYFDQDGKNCVDVMQAVSAPVGPYGPVPSDAGSIGWEQVVAWCPLSELDL